ncbi:MAG: hypothetical protein MUF43_11370 [Flavobacterium sp.]|jgi:hypothetical protein|nr:hypothetical protein [Flavobacterium sp.]
MNFDYLESRKSELYSKARNYLSKIELDENCDISDFLIENDSISYVIDHEFISVPNIMIKLNLKRKNEILSNSYYSLYLDCEFNFLDEFLVFY